MDGLNLGIMLPFSVVERDALRPGHADRNALRRPPRGGAQEGFHLAAGGGGGVAAGQQRAAGNQNCG